MNHEGNSDWLYLQDFQSPLFGTSLASQKESSARVGQSSSGESVQVSQMLCLPVSVTELLQTNLEHSQASNSVGAKTKVISFSYISYYQVKYTVRLKYSGPPLERPLSRETTPQ